MKIDRHYVRGDEDTGINLSGDLAIFISTNLHAAFGLIKVGKE